LVPGFGNCSGGSGESTASVRTPLDLTELGRRLRAAWSTVTAAPLDVVAVLLEVVELPLPQPARASSAMAGAMAAAIRVRPRPAEQRCQMVTGIVACLLLSR
jgi:hypothetical protein